MSTPIKFGSIRAGTIMQAKTVTSVAGQGRALWMSTIAFTVCFAVWTIFAIIGIQIKQQLGLNETQFGLLVGTPILTGSLVRIFLGIWTDQYGGRRVYTVVMLAAAVATFLLVYAHTYFQFLIAALGVGVAGGSFAVGIAYVSRWYPAEKQGTALGIFGAGNVGAAVTKFCAPFVLVAYGWQTTAQVWASAHRDHGGRVLVHHQRGPGRDGAPRQRRAAAQHLARARAAQERPGLALLALLFLRLRRVRRACRCGCRAT